MKESIRKIKQTIHHDYIEIGGADSLFSGIRDILTDIMHLCWEEGLSFKERSESALEVYNEEKDYYKEIKRLESIENEQVSLEVIECSCGFHLGIDATYLEQKGDFTLVCPSCSNIINTAIVCPA